MAPTDTTGHVSYASACKHCGEEWPCRTILKAENERLREAAQALGLRVDHALTTYVLVLARPDYTSLMKARLDLVDLLAKEADRA